MVDAVVIILCSTLFHHSLYQILKHVLVRRLCEPFVRWRTGRTTFTLPDGDVPHLAMLFVSFTNGMVGSICSMIVVWQARQDCLLSRAPLLIPCTHWIAQYMIYDNYAMYDADYLRKDIKRHPQLSTRLIVFVKKRWSMILHHFLLLGFGYLLVVDSEGRRNIGDFIIGTFFLRELWNPLQNLAQILKLLEMQDSIVYYANGLALILVQLVVRVLNWPIVIMIYAAQYHNWDVVKALYSLYPLCIVSTTIWQILELYWFWMIIQLVAGFTKKKKE